MVPAQTQSRPYFAHTRSMVFPTTFHADAIVITCEHGGNDVPSAFRSLFEGSRAEAALQSHRGHDPGALRTAQQLAKAFDAPLIATTISRLLIENNRSPGHRALFSEYTRELPDRDKKRIVERYYNPYRTEVEATIGMAATKGRVVHISSHSFTPVLDGKTRVADVGLLYDPHREGEIELGRLWQQRLKRTAPELRVRRNYPYVGWSDGLTTYLRTRFPPHRYVGIELEINQRFVDGDGSEGDAVRESVIASLALALGRGPAAGGSLARRRQ